MPLSAAAEHLGPSPRIAVAPLSGSPWEEGIFSPAIHTTTGLPDATLCSPGCLDRREAGRGWGGSEVDPSLSKTHGAGESRLLPKSMTPPGGLRKRTRGGPPSASVLEDRERAETSASLKPRRALLSIPPPGVRAGSPLHQPCPAPSFLLRSTPTSPSGGPERPTRPTCSDPQRRCPYLCPGGLRDDGPGASVSVIPCKTGDPDPSTSFLMGPSPCTLLEVTWPPILHS